SRLCARGWPGGSAGHGCEHAWQGAGRDLSGRASGSGELMDLIIRNACFLEADALRIADIGIRSGSIAAIEPRLAADAQELDAGECLVVPGMIETHIHLDKTCILDRCRIEEGTVAEAVRQTASAKR